MPTVPRGQRSFDEADIPAHKRAYAQRDERFLVEQAKQHSDVIGAVAETLCSGQAAWTRVRRVSALLSLDPDLRIALKRVKLGTIRYTLPEQAASSTPSIT